MLSDMSHSDAFAWIQGLPVNEKTNEDGDVEMAPGQDALTGSANIALGTGPEGVCSM
jgi:hypothetical protein